MKKFYENLYEIFNEINCFNEIFGNIFKIEY